LGGEFRLWPTLNFRVKLERSLKSLTANQDFQTCVNKMKVAQEKNNNRTTNPDDNQDKNENKK